LSKWVARPALTLPASQEHVVVYNTENQTSFTELLKYYLDHPEEVP
jgi:hypothetical protein